ncbi:unnamed protein product [Rhizopus stolonifer]
MSWDFTSTWIKYTEDLVFLPGTTVVLPKPFSYWTPLHQNIAMSIDYIECITLSLQTGIFFLMQCFWHYISRTVAERSFMSSWEFRFYILWAIGSAAVFPTLQWYYRVDVIKREAVPQLAYSIEILIAAILGIQTHARFKRIIKITQDVKKENDAVIERLIYFKDMNFFQTIALFFFSISLGIICIDGLTEAKVINYNRFASDLLIANLDTCSIVLWIIGISIFHPRPLSNDKEDSHIDPESNTENRFNEPDSSNKYTRTQSSFLKSMSPIVTKYPMQALESEDPVMTYSRHYVLPAEGPSDPLPLPPPSSLSNKVKHMIEDESVHPSSGYI